MKNVHAAIFLRRIPLEMTCKYQLITHTHLRVQKSISSTGWDSCSRVWLFAIKLFINEAVKHQSGQTA